ncbi:MAG: methyltransferase domain-containing protein [Spirochaetes bacterium]|nr:methyltransferase domain-containing protein [Spirochaetota bacterium]
MTSYLSMHHDLENPELVSVIDDVPLWSAPFGLAILDRINYRKRLTVLDIGCGLGFPLTELAMRLGASSRVYGLDPWDAALERVRLKLRLYGIANASVSKGLAENLPFENDRFDLVVSNNGLNNVQDLSLAFGECRRVSKPGAQLVFTFNTDATFGAFYDIFRSVLEGYGLSDRIGHLDRHIRSKRPPVERFLALAGQNGFSVVSAEEREFRYRFAEAEAVFSHFAMNLAFLPGWRGLVPEGLQGTVFPAIELAIEATLEREGAFTMEVPFCTVDCKRDR